MPRKDKIYIVLEHLSIHDNPPTHWGWHSILYKMFADLRGKEYTKLMGVYDEQGNKLDIPETIVKKGD